MDGGRYRSAAGPHSSGRDPRRSWIAGRSQRVTFATERQVLSYYTQQTHKALNTRSDLLYKDVLRDTARVIWRGMIRVDPGAQRTDGYQRNDSLMLSPDARADAIRVWKSRPTMFVAPTVRRWAGSTRINFLLHGPRHEPLRSDAHDRGRLLPGDL